MSNSALSVHAVTDVNQIRQALNGSILKVTTLQEFPFAYTEVHDGQIIGKGAAFEILKILADKYNFTYSVTVPRGNHYLLGRKQSIIELLTSKEVDIAVGFIPSLKEIRKYAKYSRALNFAKYHLMITKEEKAKKRGLLAPFSTKVWFCALATFLAMMPIMYGFVRLRYTICVVSGDILTFRHITWFVFSATMRQGFPKKIQHGLYIIRFLTKVLFSCYVHESAFQCLFRFPKNLGCNVVDHWLHFNDFLYGKSRRLYKHVYFFD